MASIYDENEKNNSISNKKPFLRISKKNANSSKPTVPVNDTSEKKSKRTISRKTKENIDIEKSKPKATKTSKEIKSSKKSKEKSKVQNIVEDMIQMLNSKDFIMDNENKNIEDKKVKETEPVKLITEVEKNDTLTSISNVENDVEKPNEINSQENIEIENNSEDTLPSLEEQPNEFDIITEPVKINTSIDESTAVVPDINKILKETSSNDLSIDEINKNSSIVEPIETVNTTLTEIPKVSLEKDVVIKSNNIDIEPTPSVEENTNIVSNEDTNNHKTALELNKELMEEENKTKKPTVIIPNFTVTRARKNKISRRTLSLNVNKDYDDLIVTPKPSVSINQNSSFFYEPSVFERFNIDISNASDDINTTSTSTSSILEENNNGVEENFDDISNNDLNAISIESNTTKIEENNEIENLSIENNETISNESEISDENNSNDDLPEISIDDLDLDYIDLADFENDYSDDVIDELDGSSTLKHDQEDYSKTNEDVEKSFNNIAADSISPIVPAEKTKTSIYGAISPAQHSSASKNLGIFSKGSNIFKRFSFDESALINENNNINEVLNAPIKLDNNKSNESLFNSFDINNNDINNIEVKASAPASNIIPDVEKTNIELSNNNEQDSIENSDTSYLNIETNSIKKEIEFDNDDYEVDEFKDSNIIDSTTSIDISSEDLIDSLELEDLELLDEEESILNNFKEDTENNLESTSNNENDIEDINDIDNIEDIEDVENIENVDDIEDVENIENVDDVKESIDFSEITEEDIINSNIQDASSNETIEFDDEDLDIEPTFSIEDYFGINQDNSDKEENKVIENSDSSNADNIEDEIDFDKVDTTTVFDKFDSLENNIDEEIEFDPVEDESENSENISEFNKLFETFSQKISILNEKIANLESQKNNIIEDDVIKNPVLDIENTLTDYTNNTDNLSEESSNKNTTEIDENNNDELDIDSELDDLSSLLSDDSSLLDELISNDDISLEDIENLSTDENIEDNSDEDSIESENIHNILTDSINSKTSLDTQMQHELLEELNNDNNEEINPEDATSDFIKIIDSLTKTITQLENTPDIEQSKNNSSLPEELIDENGKAINILINKDDIFSISILNESYDIVADFDGISVLSENIHISTPKKNFFVKVGNKYIEIHNKGEKFLLQTNFEDIEFANAIKNVSFAKKNNQIELNITDAFKLSSINNKVELSMLNTAIANIKEQTSTDNKPTVEKNESTSDNDDTICDNKTLLINEETQKVYLPYTIEDIMKKLNDSSNNYKTVDEVVDNEYTLPLSTFKNPIVSRFKEAYRFMRVKEKSSVYAAVDLGLELMFSSNLNPAIIRAAKDLKELNIYLDCLYENEVEKFDCFNVKYKVLPKIH